jgi:hypothetical protein
VSDDTVKSPIRSIVKSGRLGRVPNNTETEFESLKDEGLECHINVISGGDLLQGFNVCQLNSRQQFRVSHVQRGVQEFEDDRSIAFGSQM